MNTIVALGLQSVKLILGQVMFQDGLCIRICMGSQNQALLHIRRDCVSAGAGCTCTCTCTCISDLVNTLYVCIHVHVHVQYVHVYMYNVHVYMYNVYTRIICLIQIVCKQSNLD